MDIGSTGKNTHNISVNGNKWIKLSDYNSDSAEQLKNDFDRRASELCSVTGNFDILEKRMVLLEIDETPAFGLEPKVQLGIDGVVECK